MSAATDTTTCATCGSPMPIGAPFCTACGASAASRPPVSAVGAQPPAATDRDRLLPSPIGRRFWAYVIDVVWSAVLSWVVDFVVEFALVRMMMTGLVMSYDAEVTLLQLVPVVVGLIVGLILVGFVARGGTPGMRLVGIRVVRFDDGQPPGFGKALGRQLVLALSGFIIVGPFSPLFDRTGANRGWHDSASGTWVVLRDGMATPAPVQWQAASSPASSTAPIERPVAQAPVALPEQAPPLPAAPALAPTAPAVPSPTVGPAQVPPAADPARSSGPTHRAPDGLVTAVPGGAHAVQGPAHAEPADDADHTVLRGRPGALRLRFAAGDEQLDGSALVGRDPAPRPGEVVDHLIRPSDAARSMSKTHARIDVDADGVWITDRGSTNGTRLAGPGGWVALTPNVRTALQEGAEIEFGSVRATVVR